MKIAQVAPLFVTVPPKCYGGTERVIAYLTDALIRQGHEVTLYASSDSTVSCNLVPIGTEMLWKNGMANRDLEQEQLWHAMLIDMVVNDQDKYDVIHFHTDVFHLPLTRFLRTPHLGTFHNRLDPLNFDKLFTRFNEFPCVSISNNHQAHLPQAKWLGTVYHGIDKNLYTFHPEHKGYFCFVGRFNRMKRPDRAMQIAIALNTPIKIAAKLEDMEYFKEIQPLMRHPLVEFVGEISDKEKNDFIGNSKAMLFPIEWPEPFGMVLIEALACGVPVLAFNHGSVPEIIEHGRTGFIVDEMHGAIEAAKNLHSIDRAECRRAFEERFTDEHMAENYIELYKKLIDSKPISHHEPM